MTRKEPLRTVSIEVTMLFEPQGCFWEVRSGVNGAQRTTVANDTCKAPSGGLGDTPWADVVVEQILDRAWESAYSEGLQLPFP